VNERCLRDLLQRGEPHDTGARERTWRVVRAAYAEHEPRPPRRPGRAAAAVAAVLVVAAVAVTISAPGDAIARWVQHVIGAGEPDARPALVSIPGGGRLLVVSRPGVWVVAPDGAKRLLGRYDGASWSPNGLFVLAWRGGELTALEPTGRARWSLPRSRPIRSAAWSPVDGFRVAYVTGSELRIVNGDGTGDHRYGAASTAVAPAWRPDDTHVIAYADASGRVRVVAVDARREQWRSSRIDGLRKLAWAPDGRRLLALTATRLVVFSRSGEVLHERAVARGARAQDAAWTSESDRIALSRHDPQRDRSDIVLVTPDAPDRQRLLFTGPGRFGRLALSPGGERLLVPWPRADQWLFLAADAQSRVTAIANIDRQFDPGARDPASPAIAGWCCRPDTDGS
jgi:hypothetical protein